MEHELQVELVMADMLVGMALNNGEVSVWVQDTGPQCGKQRQAHFVCQPKQAAALLFLAINGDTGEESLITQLYELAEPVVESLPLNLRPIP